MITRAPRPTSNFYLLDKAISEDKRLSWAARGVLIFLLGKPDHWTVSPAALVNETAKSTRRIGRDGVYAVLKELKEVGYLHTIGNRNDGGTFAGADYMVSESPHTAFPDTVVEPHTALPDTVQPDTANPTQVSIDSKQGFKKTEKGLKSADAPAIPQSLLEDFLQVRKAKKVGALTKTALGGIEREAAKAGLDLVQAVTVCCELGWASFNAKWYAERQATTPANRFPDKNAIPLVSTVWHESAAGVEAKATELGLPNREWLESHPVFKARVMAAARAAP